jgi:hypothetical protein
MGRIWARRRQVCSQLDKRKGNEMAMTVTYSNAAPYIRERMCRHAYDSHIARTQKEKHNHIHWMVGLREALEILMRSDGWRAEPGIAEEEKLPLGAIVLARHYAADGADRLFGVETRTQCAQPADDNPTGRCLWWTEEGAEVCRMHRGSTATVPAPKPFPNTAPVHIPVFAPPTP